MIMTLSMVFLVHHILYNLFSCCLTPLRLGKFMSKQVTELQANFQVLGIYEDGVAWLADIQSVMPVSNLD